MAGLVTGALVLLIGCWCAGAAVAMHAILTDDRFDGSMRDWGVMLIVAACWPAVLASGRRDME